ncbi:hypothetical protein K1T71_013992 [Dendrolimus kikuchii]|uniref:Uncharacterized protein n=1 Tax=Dendrolimus kikuchii TaxID=765133 RepID=A0ACC1CGC3_9NEOP|nr:hypothetical protein K1T71_013992 [Dendrolimus kikuchii]
MDMKIQIVILAVLLTSSTADDYCQGIFFKEKYYNIQLLKEGVNRVHQMVYNRNDNTLYFTFEQIAKYPTRMLAFLNIKTRETGIIDSIRNATGLAIDQNANRLYVGGSDGLFFLNVNNRVTEKLPVNDDIHYLFLNSVVYFINNRKEAFIFDHGDVYPVMELRGVVVEKLIVDDDNNILFLNNKKLFRVKMGSTLINSFDKYSVDVIATDANFRPYICASSGVFVYNKYKLALDKVAEMNGLRAMTFTGIDNPIYVVIDNIVKLKYNPVPCFGD